MLFTRLRKTHDQYPRQFWLLFWGLLISTSGQSMIWPFMTIYISEKLNLAIIQVAGLLSLNAAMGLIFSFVAGAVTDRFGRKWVMVFSLAVNGLCYAAFSHASTFGQFAVLLAISGAVNPLYKVGADAMMADLIEPQHRTDAYSMLRLSNNLGVALGPAVGGFIATTSYALAFYFAAAGLIVYSLLVTLLAAETLQPHIAATQEADEGFKGYLRIWKDREYVGFIFAFTLTQICVGLVWILMAVYAKHNYGVLENQYGWIPTTNAVMVVLFQLGITQITKRYPSMWVMTLGSLLYGIGVGMVAFGHNFWGFWVAMIVITLGELTLIPTATAYAANKAPADMRGRYMSIYSLCWGIASGVSPLIGGFLNDNTGPKSTWYGGFIIGLIGAVFFAVMAVKIGKGALPRTVKTLDTSTGSRD